MAEEGLGDGGEQHALERSFAGLSRFFDGL
jgi:hypothetical protein